MVTLAKRANKMRLQYKYDVAGDIEILEVNGATCFKRVGIKVSS